MKQRYPHFKSTKELNEFINNFKEALDKLNSCGTDKEDSGKKTKTGELRQIISAHNSEPLVCSSEIPQEGYPYMPFSKDVLVKVSNEVQKSSEKVFIVKQELIKEIGKSIHRNKDWLE